MRVDVGSLSGTTSSASNTGYDATQLDMPRGEMAQYRFLVSDGFEVEFTHPSTTTRQWKTDTTNARVKPIGNDSGPWSPYDEFMWQASEFFVYEDETPRFDIYPLSVSTPRPQGHIDFHGYRFALKKIATRGILPLWVNSWPSGLGIGPG